MILDFSMFLLLFCAIPLIVLGIILSVMENSTKNERKLDDKSSYEELLLQTTSGTAWEQGFAFRIGKKSYLLK